jgi:hypothetical protein
MNAALWRSRRARRGGKVEPIALRQSIVRTKDYKGGEPMEVLLYALKLTSFTLGAIALLVPTVAGLFSSSSWLTLSALVGIDWILAGIALQLVQLTVMLDPRSESFGSPE